MPDLTVPLTTDQATRVRAAFGPILNFPQGEQPALADVEAWLRRALRPAVETQERKAHEEQFAAAPFEVAP